MADLGTWAEERVRKRAKDSQLKPLRRRACNMYALRTYFYNIGLKPLVGRKMLLRDPLPQIASTPYYTYLMTAPLFYKRTNCFKNFS
jgi:hypothetical protein